MIHLKDLGSFEFVPDLVTHIINGNITALESVLKAGWEIDKPIQIGKYSEYSPLQLALVMECLPSVKWLVEHGADLNDKENLSFLLVVRYGNKELIDYIVAQGLIFMF